VHTIDISIDVNELFPFPLDEFQLEAIEHIDGGKSVVVCAPTGSGKTVIAEYAVESALRSNRRCFYTTPLKALSNQKLFDLRVKYGENKVGLLTGDISVNRDAPVVVMTTEVYRNMLYGTSFGDVNKNLANVASVILDECHYMNDAQRGTVWEESIIYSPSEIQLVALSATVANAEELTEWIDQTHGPTALVSSSFRPVPLRFYYFGGRKIYPLLRPGGSGMNPQLKSAFGGKQRFPRRGGGKKRMEDVPDPRDVLMTLYSKEMLPAIYFLFSRRGCEESMKKCRGVSLVTDEERRQIKKAVEELIEGNENLRSHPHLLYLYEGMSVHHAGMLPSWKHVVEKLFQKGFLKVVFATETLAAGINMPARTTIISAISKRADEGHRSLTASEFLQMSGRAGRRGMDEIGHVAVLSHPFESVEDAAKLAAAPADPLESRFTPSYGMVLNLLQRHTMDEAKDLIERSFGQFLLHKQLDPLFLQKMVWERELEKLSKPLCPGELGDLPQYTRYLEAASSKQKQIKNIERSLSHHGDTTGSGAQAVGDLKAESLEFQRQAHAMPCHGCPEQKPCSKQSDRVRALEGRVKEMTRRVNREHGKYWREFEALSNILRLQGYLDANTPTKLGMMTAALRAGNELFVSEVIVSGVLNKLRPPEMAAVVTALVSEEDRIETAMRIRMGPSADLALEKIHKIGRSVHRLQRDFDVEIPVEFSPVFSGITQLWADGAQWEDIRRVSQFDEGDIVRALRRTVDLLRQMIRAPGVADDLVDLCMETERLIARDEVKEDFS
jgi:superfamily II RNA helicase